MSWIDGALRGLGIERGPEPTVPGEVSGKILIVGSPNVGKSVLFNQLTGDYATVSNYPGTTVEVSTGSMRMSGKTYTVVDTPGIYSLSPITEEERVTCDCLLKERPHVVVHVVDAKNVARMLGLTLQLAEAGLPLILVLNMGDEARAAGVRIDTAKLQQLIGVPCVETVATTGEGIAALVRILEKARPVEATSINYGSEIEQAIVEIAHLLPASRAMSARARALLLLQEDTEQAKRLLVDADVATAGKILGAITTARSRLDHSLHYYCTLAMKRKADLILEQCLTIARPRFSAAETLSRLLMQPLVGFPILVLVLYYGLYRFVGGFGAGTLVDFLENTVFGAYINPWTERMITAFLPWTVLQDLFIGPYGIVTLGIRYAVAIILPIVATFFLSFAILEDSGYLPRLAMLIDRTLKRIGLNGRAVIPLVLGFGCGTMATLVTRTLETRRERIIATLLLALAVPCSAQVGVVLGLLGGHPLAMATWAAVVLAVFLMVGTLLARLMPGARPSFYMELPPLRLPRPGNVLLKTWARMVWYFKEVLPLFILASLLIWIGNLAGLFQLLVKMLKGPVNFLGLPDQAAVAFLFGFFRRDYGAAGLYDLQKHGILNGNQLAVAAITLTLFLPCVAQVLIMKKERGSRFTFMTALAVGAIAFSVGFLTNLFLNLFGVTL